MEEVKVEVKIKYAWEITEGKYGGTLIIKIADKVVLQFESDGGTGEYASITETTNVPQDKWNAGDPMTDVKSAMKELAAEKGYRQEPLS